MKKIHIWGGSLHPHELLQEDRETRQWDPDCLLPDRLQDLWEALISLTTSQSIFTPELTCSRPRAFRNTLCSFRRLTHWS